MVNPDLSIKAAGGYIIQLLPTADEDVISKVEKSIKDIKPVTTMMDEGCSLEEIVKTVLKEFDVEVLSTSKVDYRCNCSRARTEKVLLALSKDDLEKLADEQDTTEVSCSFCNKKYKFTSDDIRKLILKKIEKKC